MALTQEQLNRILGRESVVQRAFNENRPTVSTQKPNSPSLSAISNVLDTIRKPLNVYGLNKNIPVVGGTTFADVTGLNQIAPLTQDVAYGQPLMRGGSLQTMQADPRLAGLVDFIPAVGGAAKLSQVGAKAGLKEIARQIQEGTGIIGRNIIDPRMYAYLPDTPSKPNPLVGTRFVSESQGNLVPEVQVPIEKIKGASIVGTPYDNTPADTLISSISGDINLTNPIYTMGGDDFSRLINNYNQNIGGASNYGMASKMNNRFDVARKENLATKGGTGEVYSTPFNMSDEVPSEAFSSYPTDIITQIINQQGNKKSIPAFNEWFRNSKVPVKKGSKTIYVQPFTTFKGIETPEGLAQLYSGEGFGVGGTSGNARKNLFKGASLNQFEKMFDYNIKDIRGAVNVPEYANLPKGYARGNLIQIPEKTILTPSSLGSKIKAYDTDTAGLYAGRINTTLIQYLMPKTYNRIYAEMKNKYPNYSDKSLLNMTVGAMEKRGENISEVVDDQVIDSYYGYQEGLLGK